MVWLLGFFFSFLAKISGKEHRVLTILQFLLWAVLEEKDVGGLGIEEGWGKQICPVSEPRVWDVRWKSGKVWTDYRGPKCWTISRIGLRQKRKGESKSLPLEQGAQHL